MRDNAQKMKRTHVRNTEKKSKIFLKTHVYQH